MADTDIINLAGLKTFKEKIEEEMEALPVGGAITKIKVNSVEQTIVDKTVDITVPTTLSALTDDVTHRIVTDTEKETWNAKYSKPTDGITKDDLASAVQTSLGEADSAVQTIKINDVEQTKTNGVVNLPAYPTTLPASDVSDWAKATTKPTYTASEVGALPDTTDLTKYALSTEAGYDLGLSMDSSTYVMTLELKNKAGTVLATKTLDMPIESMVVNASYKDGKITLTLQSGSTLEVDISAIVSGLVNDTFTIAGIDMKDNITATELKTALGVPSSFAPVNAQANVIETVKVNGTALTPSSKAVDVTVPTKTSDLTNDLYATATDTQIDNLF